MGLKDIVKVANYYDVKYDLKKEADELKWNSPERKDWNWEDTARLMTSPANVLINRNYKNWADAQNKQEEDEKRKKMKGKPIYMPAGAGKISNTERQDMQEQQQNAASAEVYRQNMPAQNIAAPRYIPPKQDKSQTPKLQPKQNFSPVQQQLIALRDKANNLAIIRDDAKPIANQINSFYNQVASGKADLRNLENTINNFNKQLHSVASYKNKKMILDHALGDLLKLAGYKVNYNYGFNKEAQSWEKLVDNKAFKPKVNQELWSDDYKTYMKWDGSRWVPQERYDAGSKDVIAPDPYQSVYHRGTHYRDDRTGLEYTIEPGTERRIPIEAKKFFKDVVKKPEQEPTLEESLSGVGGAGALEKIKLEPLPFRPYKEPKTDTKVDKSAPKPVAKPAAGGKMPTLGDKDSLYMQAVLMRDSFKKNPQLKQYEQEARSLANSWGSMPKDQFKQRLFDLQFRALKAANPEALPGLKPGKLEKI